MTPVTSNASTSEFYLRLVRRLHLKADNLSWRATAPSRTPTFQPAKMLQNARKSGSTGRTAASLGGRERQQWDVQVALHDPRQQSYAAAQKAAPCPK
jgi:hypothetical protein